MTVALLAGCTSPTPEPEVTTPATSPTPTPTPSETPVASGPRDLSDPDLGIVFTDFPRETDETTAAAVETYMLFEKEFWRALTTNVVPPGPWAIASDDSIAWIQAQVGPNSANGWHAGGSYQAAVEVLTSGDATMTLAVCTNWGDVTFENTDGTVTTAVEGGLPETSGTRLTLVESTTGWRVETHELTGSC